MSNLKTLKEKVLNRIQNLKDENILKEIQRLLNTGLEETGIYELNEEQLNAVQEAQAQVRNGDFLTDEEARNDLDEWLKNE